MFSEQLLKTLSFALGVFSLLSLSSCGLPGSRQNNDLQSEIEGLRAVQAEQTREIQELQSELRRTFGRIEELEYTVGGQVEENRERVANMALRLPPPKGVPENLLDQDMDLKDAWVNDHGLSFRDALIRLRQGDFDGARGILLEYVEVNRDSEIADNALFWLGVCLEISGKVDNSVLAYSDVYKFYPKGDRAVDSLFYMARAYEKSATPEIAKLTLQKLIDEHPKSSYARLAKDKLKK